MAKQEKAALPPLPPNSTRKPPAGRYREMYGVVVICPDEAEQRKVYEGLAALFGCKLRVVAT